MIYQFLKMYREKLLSGALILSLNLFPLFSIAFYEAPLTWLFANLMFAIFGIRLLRNRKLWISVCLIFFALQVINSSYYFSHYLQGEGFNERFFYHLKPNALAGGVSEFSLQIIALLALCIVSTFLPWFISKARQSHPQNITRHRIASASTLFIALLLYTPLHDTLGYFYFANNPSNNSTQALKLVEAIERSSEITPPVGKKKNIVFLYLESVEQSFFDNEYYPNLMPELNKIRKQSLDFSSITQVPEASWTIAGIVASQCAVPLFSPHSKSSNNPAISDNFMNGANCLSDILKAQQYHTEYLGGADTRFAGKKIFLNAHQYSKIQGKQELVKKLKNRKYSHGWGIYDDSLFGFANERFDKLSQQNEPFLLTMLTLDTHHPNGHLSKSCKPFEGESKENSIIQSLHCTDQLVSNFIKKIRQGPHSDDTIIIVMSDHLAMRNNLWNRIKAYPKERQVLFFVNHPEIASNQINNKGTHFDVAPTILDILGYEGFSNELGLGSSLLTGPGTFHKNNFDLALVSDPAIKHAVSKLWEEDFGSVFAGLSISKNGTRLKIGNRSLNLSSEGWNGRSASLIQFNPQNGAVENIEVWAYHQNIKPNDLSKKIFENPDKVFFSIAEAPYLEGLIGIDDKLKEKQRVFFFGSAGGYSNVFGFTNSKGIQNFTESQIKKVFTEVKSPDPEILKLREFLVYSPKKIWQRIKERHYSKYTDSLTSAEFKTCDFNKCESSANINGEIFKVNRGINVFAVNNSSKAERIFYRDGCVKYPKEDKNNSLDSLLEKYKNADHIIAITHDTAYCNSQKLNFKRWIGSKVWPKSRDLKFRESFVGLYDPQTKESIEYLSANKHFVHLKLTEGILKQIF